MVSKFLVFLSLSAFIVGCAHRTTRDGIISEDLPLTVDDLAEIKEGKRNHERVLWEYRVYQSPNLEKYCNAIARSIADVSERPHLPYAVTLLDTDEVSIFGGPGGYIYVTRGVFNFINSEAELAGAIAHEIVHVANYEYSGIPQLSKIKTAYNWALQGSEFAKSSIGTYGTALNVGLKGVGRAAPVIAKRYGKDDEIETDEKVVGILLKAGYDPHGYLKFVEKLTQIEMDDIERFAIYMNTHPPFADRRIILTNRIGSLGHDGALSFKKDMMLAEIRQDAMTQSPEAIIFKPPFVSDASDLEMKTVTDEKKAGLTSYRDKRWGLF